MGKNQNRKQYQYAQLALLDYPRHMWRSLEQRSDDLNISLSEFLDREQRINRAQDAQLSSLDPAVSAQGGHSGKPSPAKIERIYERMIG